MLNDLILAGLSLIVIANFIYFNFYRFYFSDHIFNYLKRVLATYLLALAAAAVFLTLFDKAPWDTALLVTVRRMIIVAFPASMSATISDVIK